MPDLIDDQTTRDIHEAACLASYVDPDPDLDAVTDTDALRVLAQQREALIGAYAWLLLQQLDADPGRLAAAAAGCRACHDEVAATDPDDQRLVGTTGAGLNDHNTPCPHRGND